MDAPRKNTPERIVPKLVIGLMLGMIVMACFLLFADLKQITRSIASMPKHWLVLAFILTFGSYCFRLWKWHAFSRWSDFKISFKDNTAIFFIGLMMSITPGKAGELIKSYLLQRKGNVPYSASLPVVIYDRLTDLLAMMALVGIGLLVYPFGLASLIGLFVLIVLFAIVIQQKAWMSALINRLTRRRKLQRFNEPLHGFYNQTLSLMRLRILSFSFVVSFIAWFLECGSLYVLLHAFDADISLTASILTFSLGTIAGALSMIPGGLGAAEGSITGLLVYFGLTGSLAVIVSLIVRFVTLWFGVIIGIIVFLAKRKSFFSSNN